jgi:thiol-disulfide isomerase/thioredoxin
MKRRQLAVLAAVAGGAGLATALWQSRRSREESAAEAAFWKMRFERPEGGELALATWQGRPLLLNFWATWCAPCVTEMPLLDGFHRNQGEGGIQVLGLAVDGPSPVREFLARRPMGFAIGLAGLDGIELARSLGNPSGALPFSVLFDASGRAVDHKLGALHPPELQAWAGRFAVGDAKRWTAD